MDGSDAKNESPIMIPEEVIREFYMLTNPYPIANRFHSYLKKFRKIEQFIKDQRH